jgi:hypothetical protein
LCTPVFKKSACKSHKNLKIFKILEGFPFEYYLNVKSFIFFRLFEVSY